MATKENVLPIPMHPSGHTGKKHLSPDPRSPRAGSHSPRGGRRGSPRNGTRPVHGGNRNSGHSHPSRTSKGNSTPTSTPSITNLSPNVVPEMLRKISKEDLPVSDLLLAEDLTNEKNINSNKPRIFMSKKTQKMYVKFPNGDHYEVANPPERAKDDSTIINGQLSRTGSLTVLKRTSSPRRQSSQSRTSSQASLQSDSYASIDLGTEHLPSIDTPEASHVCSLRIRHILRKLEKDDISKEDLIKNLTYAASVLETVYIDETKPAQHNDNTHDVITNDSQSQKEFSKKMAVRQKRSHPNSLAPPVPGAPNGSTNPRRLCDEEDELSEVEPDAVPSEVRDWLALTFTRSMSNIKRRGDDKPKFRSVAHAIRAGIMVDRIYRRMSSTVGLHIPPDILIQLKGLDDWGFDVFSLNEIGDGHVLKYTGYELLQRYDIITKFKINTTNLENFLHRLEQGYLKHNNPYHNAMHAADVTQTTHHLISQSGLALWLTDLEIYATMVAAMIHDFEHTGTTNNYHINTGSDVALLYNDRAVLENHHISAAFRIMKEEECNILNNLKREEYRDFRSLVIDMVLATDMSYHFQQIKNMKNLLSMPENIDKSKALSLVLHCADISHPAKSWRLHLPWTENLLEEFFRQGDHEAELGLPYSPLCDRKNTLVAESQIGFIDFIVDPSFTVMGDMLDKIILPLHQRNTIAEENSRAVDKATSTTSLCSRSSTPSTNRSGSLTPTGAPYSVQVKRTWVECLANNKLQWKERAQKETLPGKALKPTNDKKKNTDKLPATDAELRQKALADEKKSDDQADSGVESPVNSKDPPGTTATATTTAEKVTCEAGTSMDRKSVTSTQSSTPSPKTTPSPDTSSSKVMTRHTSTTGLLQKEVTQAEASSSEVPPREQKTLLQREIASLQNPKSNLTRTMSSPAGSLMSQGFKITNDLHKLLEKCEEGNTASSTTKKIDCGIGPSPPPDSAQSSGQGSQGNALGNSNNNNESSSSSGSLSITESEGPMSGSSGPRGSSSNSSRSSGSREAKRIIRQESVKRITSSLEQQLERQQQAKFSPVRPPRSPRSARNSNSGTQSPESTRTNSSRSGSIDRSIAGSGSMISTGSRVEQLKQQITTGGGNSTNACQSNSSTTLLTNSVSSVTPANQDEDDDDVFVRAGESAQSSPQPPVQQEDTIKVIKPPRRIQPAQQSKSHGHMQVDDNNLVDLGMTHPGAHLGPALMPPYASRSVDLITENARHTPEVDRRNDKR